MAVYFHLKAPKWNSCRQLSTHQLRGGNDWSTHRQQRLGLSHSLSHSLITLHSKLLPQSIASEESTLEYSSVEYDRQNKQTLKVKCTNAQCRCTEFTVHIDLNKCIKKVQLHLHTINILFSGLCTNFKITSFYYIVPLYYTIL